MVKAKKISPEKGLGATYHSQADSPHDVWNKWNWACAICGEIYLNRWKAMECFDSHKAEKENRCPHCNGQLKSTKEWQDYQWECMGCGRGWQVEGNIWKALFDAGSHVYRKTNGEFEDITPAPIFRRSEGE